VDVDHGLSSRAVLVVTVILKRFKMTTVKRFKAFLVKLLSSPPSFVGGWH
jgi:hypothetical protein